MIVVRPRCQLGGTVYTDGMTRRTRTGSPLPRVGRQLLPGPPPGRPAAWQPAPVAAAPAAEEPQERESSLFQEVLETILLAVVLFVALRTVVQSTVVLSHSMDPTLREGQYLLVNKLAYKIGAPARGDIAVFHSLRTMNTLSSGLSGSPAGARGVCAGTTRWYIRRRPPGGELPGRR